MTTPLFPGGVRHVRLTHDVGLAERILRMKDRRPPPAKEDS